jgi:hypothetical protein
MPAQFFLTRYDARFAHRDDMIDLYELAAATGLHPELARRLYSLGLLNADQRSQNEPLFSYVTVGRLRRMIRLRRDLGLTWSSLGLISDLLERIDLLEQHIRTQKTTTGQR